MSDKDIEDIREKKKRELRKRMESQGQETPEEVEEQQKKQEAMKKQMLRQILTEDARQRIENVKMVDAERAGKVEQALLSQIPDPSQLQEKIGEDKIKEILKELKDDNDFDIKRRWLNSFRRFYLYPTRKGRYGNPRESVSRPASQTEQSD